MRDRREMILRMACVALALLVAWQLLRAGFRVCSLVRVKIPAVPTLVSDDPKSAKDPAAPPATVKLSTNAPAAPSPQQQATNRSPAPVSNLIAVATPSKPMGTNISNRGTNSPALASGPEKTNPAPTTTMTMNQPPSQVLSGNAVMGMNGGPLPMRGTPGGSLPPPIQARVDKIVDSELFGPVMHPIPMALIGIAGDVAFLRTGSGQTGLVKEGDTLGDVKLLRIGINRVLVSTGGQTNELTIFNGYGSESLLSEPKETPK